MNGRYIDCSPNPSNTHPFRAFPSWLLFGTIVVFFYVMQPAENSTHAGVAVPLGTDVAEHERVSGELRSCNCAQQPSGNANRGEAMNDNPKTERKTVKVDVVLYEKYLYVTVCQVPRKDGSCVYAKGFVVLPGGKNDYTGWAYDDLRKLGQGSHEIEYRR